MRAVLIWLVLIIAGGLVVFEIKERVAELSRELTELNTEIAAEQKRIEALRAEWSWLNRPSVLSAASRQSLPLAPARSEQVVPLQRVQRRLPSPRQSRTVPSQEALLRDTTSRDARNPLR